MDIDAPATLMKWPSLHGERIRSKDGAQPYTVAQGTLSECLGRLQGKPASSLHLYELHMPDGSVVPADEALAGQQSNDPAFTIEEDKVGLGYCVAVQWQDGRREVVTGFGDERQATRWIEVDSAKWLLDIPKRIQGEQWVNNHLPKAE